MTNPDWATIASLATAGGTLVLAVSTFASVKSANRAARAAERSLLAGLRPLLMPSRLQDPPQKILFGDGKWVPVPGGGGAAEVGEVGPGFSGAGAGGENGAAAGGGGAGGESDGAPADGEFDLVVSGEAGRAAAEGNGTVVYLAISLRNAGSGIAIVHGWRFAPGHLMSAADHPSPDFRRQSRDLYIPAGDIGFWQAAFRDPADPQYQDALKAADARQPMTIDLLYGDHEGGQRVETRFSLLPRDTDKWIVSASRYHNVDRPDPR